MDKDKYTLKELKNEAKKRNFVDTGFFIYIGFKEKWTHCVIDGIECDEFVSSLGRIYNPETQKLAKLVPVTGDYLVATVHSNRKSYRKRVNRIVLESFKGSPPKDMICPEADHIIPNQQDNSIDNLQWLSKHDNIVKEMDERDINGENNSWSKYTNEQVHQICKLLVENKLTIREIANKVGVKKGFVHDIKLNRSWVHISSQYDYSHYNIIDVDYNVDISNKIKELILANKTNSEIIQELNLQPGQKVHDVLSHQRKKLGKGIYTQTRYSKEDLKKLDQYILENKSVSEICKLLGFDKTQKIYCLISSHKRKLKKQNKLK